LVGDVFCVSNIGYECEGEHSESWVSVAFPECFIGCLGITLEFFSSFVFDDSVPCFFGDEAGRGGCYGITVHFLLLWWLRAWWLAVA
jgi:hypothetical protein